MVEYKCGIYDEGSDDSPPLVQAEPAIIGLNTLEPIGVAVVTIGGDPLCQEASVISTDSADGITSTTESDHAGESSQTWSAGIAGGVVGTLICGPVLGLVAGLGSAYYSQRDGAAGDITRAMGEVAQTTGVKAKELNEKHNLVDKSKDAADSAWKKVKDLNQTHHIADRSQEAANGAWENFKEFDRKHGVVNKVKEFALFCFKQIVKIAEYAAGRLQESEPREESAGGAQAAGRIPGGAGTGGWFAQSDQSYQKLAQATAY